MSPESIIFVAKSDPYKLINYALDVAKILESGAANLTDMEWAGIKAILCPDPKKKVTRKDQWNYDRGIVKCYNAFKLAGLISCHRVLTWRKMEFERTPSGGLVATVNQRIKELKNVMKKYS